ncbi:MAG TPA: hypothetical protein VNL18_04985 [Gemmatimonadales bacterium]|nr:hypothetical protein [Gemmatimonadales bacterium]
MTRFSTAAKLPLAPMLRSVITRYLQLCTLAAVGGAALGCSDSLLGPPTSDNVIDTVTLYALSGTAISLPSGYSMLDARPVRTDSTDFDFAFDITESGTTLIYPAGALGLSSVPGLQRSTKPFAEITMAPTEGYEGDSALAVSPNDVFLARSRTSISGCYFFGQVSRYGKFRVLSLDLSARSITLELLVNLNCGYKSLDVGRPDS